MEDEIKILEEFAWLIHKEVAQYINEHEEDFKELESENNVQNDNPPDSQTENNLLEGGDSNV